MIVLRRIRIGDRVVATALRWVSYRDVCAMAGLLPSEHVEFDAIGAGGAVQRVSLRGEPLRIDEGLVIHVRDTRIA